jgi:ABC-2 type transport system ATP-binding protein
LLGLLQPTQGSAEVLGYDTQKQAAAIREQTGALLEHTGLYERLSAEANLDFFGRIYRLPDRERRLRVQEQLERMGLWERRKEIVNNWSRGMKQKLAVARAMMHRPRLIFLDEPTAGLDPIASAALRDDLASLAAGQRVTIFLTTHNLADAERLCQQVAVIRDGKLLVTGSPEALRSGSGDTLVEIHGKGFSPELIDRLRGVPEVSALEQINHHLVLKVRQETEMAPIVQLMILGGAQVEEVRKSKASLEEIFLDLVEEEKQEA